MMHGGIAGAPWTTSPCGAWGKPLVQWLTCLVLRLEAKRNEYKDQQRSEEDSEYLERPGNRGAAVRDREGCRCYIGLEWRRGAYSSTAWRLTRLIAGEFGTAGLALFLGVVCEARFPMLRFVQQVGLIGPASGADRSNQLRCFRHLVNRFDAATQQDKREEDNGKKGDG